MATEVKFRHSSLVLPSCLQDVQGETRTNVRLANVIGLYTGVLCLAGVMLD